jgi:hypothetical protein
MDAGTLESLLGLLGNKEVVSLLGKSVKAKPTQVKKASELGLSTLLEALNRNTNNQQGAESLAKALEQHQDDDVSDIASFLKNVDTEDGEKILGHVFGNKKRVVENNIAKKTGLDIGQIGSLLTQFAPLVLGLLGNQKKQQNLDSAGVSGLTSMLSGLFGGKKQQGGGNLLSMASSFLDADGDGNFLNDLGKLLG